MIGSIKIVLLIFFRTLDPKTTVLVSKAFRVATLQSEDHAFLTHRNRFSNKTFFKLLTKAKCTEAMASAQKNHLLKQSQIRDDFNLIAWNQS